MELKAFFLSMMISLVVSESYASMVFTLHRFSPPNSPLDPEVVRAQDESRHFTVPKYPLKGFGTLRSNGIYYTTVKLGTPAKELSVSADTGSNLLWVNCKPCNNCPESIAAETSKNLFDVTTSSTASFRSCSDNPKCSTMMDKETEDGCVTEDNSRCKYRIGYKDGTKNEGYYVTDLLTYSTIYSGVATTSDSINFGCGFNQSGRTMPEGTFGILGFGQDKHSIVSQLHKRGVSPNVVSHCLRGDSNGGGTLVIGEATTPNMVYTKLLKSGEGHYPVSMESVSVDGKLLPIKYASSDRKEIIVDSGTTLTYIWPEVYDPVVDAIASFSAKSDVPSFTDETWSYCFTMNSSVTKKLPEVRLNFAGGVSLVLQPKDYLVQTKELSDNQWCIGFLRADRLGVAILGDLVLKDKIVVYDIARQRIGWAAHDCSLPLNISTTSGANNAAHTEMFSIIFIGIVTLFCLL